MDATCRELLRAWRRDPADAVAADACAAALHRARVELPWDIIQALSRWRRPLELVARFAAAPPTEADGWPESALLEAEGRLGLRLPAALREWYRAVGRWGGAPQLRGWLVDPRDLALVDGLLVVLRALEARLSVREADLARVDPPAFVEHDRYAEGTGSLGGPLSVTLGGRLAFEVARDGPWSPAVRTGTTSDRSEPPLSGLRYLQTGERLDERWGESLHADEELLVVRADGAAALQVRALGVQAWTRAEALGARGA